MTNLDLRFQAAVQQFCTGRNETLQRKIEAGNLDADTAGGHMGAIKELIVDLLLDASLDRLDIKIRVKGQRPQTALKLPAITGPRSNGID